MDEQWEQLAVFSQAEKEILARLGALYMKLEETRALGSKLAEQIESNRGQLALLRASYEQVQGSLIDNIVREKKLPDGDYSIDLQTRKIEPTNGSVPNRIDSSSGPND